MIKILLTSTGVSVNNIKVADKWYEHTPKTVTENENETCTILWDMPLYTDKEIKSNRPDIII